MLPNTRRDGGRVERERNPTLCLKLNIILCIEASNRFHCVYSWFAYTHTHSLTHSVLHVVHFFFYLCFIFFYSLFSLYLSLNRSLLEISVSLLLLLLMVVVVAVVDFSTFRLMHFDCSSIACIIPPFLLRRRRLSSHFLLVL